MSYREIVSHKKYDICFLGGGVATAIHLLAHQEFFRSKKVLILEKSSQFDRDKTICSFSKADLPFLKTKKWWRFQAKTKLKQMSYDSKIPYQFLDLKELYDQLEKFLSENPNIEVEFNRAISSFQEREPGFLIDEFEAEHIIDSRPLMIDQEHWIQHFYGVEVEFEEDHLIHGPVIMDIDESFKEGLKFYYLIPKSPRRLLVELTFFSAKVFEKEFYKKDLEAYLLENFSKKVKAMKEEFAQIPLVVIKPPEILPKNYHVIGCRAGNLRASTGYSVWRSLFQSVERGPLPSLHQDLKWTFIQWMDEVFLRVLRARPDLAAMIFGSFLEKLKAPSISSFMSENPSWLSLLKVILVMPWAPFSKALLTKKTMRNSFSWRALD